MSVIVDQLNKAGLAQTDLNSVGQDGSSAGQTGVFQALLNLLKPEETQAPAGGLRNKPATAQVIGRDSFPAPNTARGSALNTQTVNTLATSALIAFAAISSGRNMEGLCRQGAPLPAGLTGVIPEQAGVSQTSGNAGANLDGQEIGALSARFESGGVGPGVVGYDPSGGTSYGIYQISSRAGTMKQFIDYLSTSAPEIAQKLQAAGPSNTGGRDGKMVRAWKDIASADPVRFQKLQTAFIQGNLYLPTVQEISDRTGVDVSKAPKALQEVLWSTAVQHGSKGAADIFTKAIKSVENQNDQLGVAKLINTVYDMRANKFGSSGPGIRAAVRNRLRAEGKIALSMLSGESSNASDMPA